jgi:hypothetical protein
LQSFRHQLADHAREWMYYTIWKLHVGQSQHDNTDFQIPTKTTLHFGGAIDEEKLQYSFIHPG